jgi:DNA polymerase-3 subunit alpha (Gram-positive type)
MNIPKVEPTLARLLVSDLVARDPRLQLNEDMVELIQNGFDTRRLLETDFVVFDLETTGAKAPPCRITEIGAWRISNGSITEEFHTLVNPECPIPAFISSLTGITDEMVRDAPVFNDVAEMFMDFIGDSVLVAHNASFDMRFLNHEIGLLYEDYRVANPCLCTVHLSRKLLPDIENHKLKTVAQHFEISLVNHHRASEDARATAEIFVHLIERLNTTGIYDVASVRNLGLRKGAYVA